MKAEEIMRNAQEEFARLTKVPVERLIGLSRTEEGWVVSVEGLERRAIPDTMDILGLYEVRLDNEGGLIAFERKSLRKRGETQGD